MKLQYESARSIVRLCVMTILLFIIVQFLLTRYHASDPSHHPSGTKVGPRIDKCLGER
jgi:hypothetical protein